MISFIIFLLILSVLVIIHELGHFLVARKFNIKVEEFGFGLPPRAWGKKIGETIYSINWLPIGGFVKLFGEDDAGSGRVGKSDVKSEGDVKRAFYARSVRQRGLVVVAGVVMNAILAVVIFYIFLSLSGFSTKVPLITDHKFFLVNQENKIESFVITGVAKDSPASKAGVVACEKESCLSVVSIDGISISDSDRFINYIKTQQGKEVEFSFVDLVTKKEFTKKITPRSNPPEGEGALGIQFSSNTVAVLNYDTPVYKLLSGFSHPANLMVYQFVILADLITISFENKTAEPVGSAFSGPVGVFVVTAEVLKIPDLKERMLSLLNLAGLLSATLAVFNILPIPALDGGRLLFIVIEGMTGRKVNQKTEAKIHTVGMAILLGLIIVITFKDIYQFFIK